MALSEARPESFFAAEKDLRDWIPFLRFFFFFLLAVLGKIERLERRRVERAGFLLATTVTRTLSSRHKTYGVTHSAV